MSFELDLENYLKGEAELQDLVEDRIFPQAAKQKTDEAYITYEKTGGADGQHFGGSDGLVEAQYRFRCYHTNYHKANKVRQQLDNELNQLRDDNGTAGAIGEFYVRKGKTLDTSDNFIPPKDGGGYGIHELIIDWNVHYNLNVLPSP